MITKKDIDNATMHINGVNIADYGVLVESMKVGAIETTTDVYQGVNRTNFNVLNTTQYMRALSVNLFYSAPTRRDLALINSGRGNHFGRGKRQSHCFVCVPIQGNTTRRTRNRRGQHRNMQVDGTAYRLPPHMHGVTGVRVIDD